MTSVLNVDTIADKAGTGPVALTKQSAAKVWVNLNGSSFGLRDSFGVSSADDDGTGDYGINFTNSFSDANYSVTQCASYDGGTGAQGRYLSAPQGSMTTSELEFVGTYDYNQSQDVQFAFLQLMGDLA